ncbi:MAG: restriction endonuclease subunit S [Cycloclasticus sp.]|jgi:Restriction endonuclease S subunits
MSNAISEAKEIRIKKTVSKNNELVYTNLKGSVLEGIPLDWKVCVLGEISKLERGKFSHRPRNDPEFYSGEIPFLQTGDIPKQSPYITSFSQTLNEKGLSVSKLFEKGTLVITIAATIGEVGVLKFKSCFPDSLVGISVNKDIGGTMFVLYAMQYLKDELDSLAPKSAQKNINLDILSSFPIPFPPLPEQQKIAAILSSVDDVIEKTQAQINKLKDLKTGMMQELLSPREPKAGDQTGVQASKTNGLHHTEFKDSPLGRIPIGWDCQLLDKVAKRGSGHTPDKKKAEYWNDGVKWISLTDSSKLDQLYISKTAKNVSSLGIENSSAVLHPAGTVVMTRDAGIGKSAITTDVMAVSQHLIAWVCGEKLDNYFLYYILQLWKPQFEAIAMGSTIKTIGLPYFKQLKVPVPPIEEQENIANSIKSADLKIFSLEKKNSQNIAIKKALMQDLLTGNVRVKVDAA